MKGSLVYANARAKTLENTLLSGEKITRMVFAESSDEGLRILAEGGYGGGVPAESGYDALLAGEFERICAFLKESAPAGSGVESLLTPNDYHNAKALMKGKYMRLGDVSFMLAPAGGISAARLAEKIAADDYSGLPAPMSEALAAIDADMAAGNRSPRGIDVRLDRALYRDGTAQAKAGKQKSIVDYWRIDADFANVSAFARSQKIGADWAFFARGFVDGGALDEEFFRALYPQGTQALAERLRYAGYPKAAEALIADDMPALERAWDNALLALFREDRSDLFSVAPIAGLFVAKKIELKVVRMILTLLKNNADKAEIKRRMRDFYA